MKTTFAAFFALLLGTQILFSQTIDFRISDTRIPATYTQRSPYLYAGGEQGFIVAWEDYRLGDMQYFAQRFDKYGSPVGSNFSIDNNEYISIHNDGGFFVLRESTQFIFLPPYDDITRYYGHGIIYDAENNMLQSHYIGDAYLGGCGMGYMGIWHSVSSMNSGFLYVTNLNGLNMNRFDVEGNLSYRYQEVDLYTGNIATAITKDDNYLVVHVSTYDWEMNYGVYGTFFSQADSILADSVLMYSYFDYDYFWYENLPHLEAVTFSDSLYRVFIAGPDSMVLYTAMFTKDGDSFDEGKKYTLLDDPPADSQWHYIKQIKPVYLYDGTLELHILYSYRIAGTLYYQTEIFSFDHDGSYTGRHTGIHPLDRMIIRGVYCRTGESCYTTGSEESDVFLYTAQNSAMIDTLRINDDSEGSNQTSPSIASVDNERFFVSWTEEEGYYGREVSTQGVLSENVAPLEGRHIVFSEDGNRFVFWRKSLENDRHGFGYSIYDTAWNVINRDTLVESSTISSIDGKGYYIDTNKVLVLYRHGNVLRARLLESDGSLHREIIISETGSAAYQAFIEPDDGIWIVSGYDARMFDFDLEPVTEPMRVPWGTKLYLGDGRFLNVESYYLGRYFGTIMTMEGDTLVSQFPIAKYVSEVRLARLDDNHFMALFTTMSNLIAGKVFGSDGVALADSFLVHRSTPGSRKNPTLRVNDTYVFTAWSDNRSPDGGYDIYGRVFKVSTLITSVPEQLPGDIPLSYRLFQNYPNPFNPATTIEYSISHADKVRLSVYDILGREISVLIDEYQNAGTYRLIFDAGGLSSGIYIYRLHAGEYSEMKRMTLIK